MDLAVNLYLGHFKNSWLTEIPDWLKSDHFALRTYEQTHRPTRYAPKTVHIRRYTGGRGNEMDDFIVEKYLTTVTHPFTITVILSHVYAVQRRLLIVMNALACVNCFNYMQFWFVLLNVVCHCSIKAIWWWRWWWWWWWWWCRAFRLAIIRYYPAPLTIPVDGYCSWMCHAWVGPRYDTR